MDYTIKTLTGYGCLAAGVPHISFIYEFYETEDYYHISGSGNFVSSFIDCKFSKKNYENHIKNINDPYGAIWLEFKKIYNFPLITKLRYDFPFLQQGCCLVDPTLFDGLTKVYILADGLKSFFKVCKSDEKNKNLIEIANIDLKMLLPDHDFRNHFEPPYNIISFKGKRIVYTRLNKMRGVRQLLAFISDDNSWNFNRSEVINIDSSSGMTKNSIYNAKMILKNNKIYCVFCGYNKEINDLENNLWKIRDKEMLISAQSYDGINFTEIECLVEEKNASYSMILVGGGIDTILYTNSSLVRNGSNKLHILKIN